MTATQHSANDSDNFYIPSTEAPLNAFRQQIILNEGIDHVATSEPFTNYKKFDITISNTSDSTLLHVLKKYFDPSKLNGLFTSEALMGKIQEMYKKNFGRQNLLKIRFTHKLLKDIENYNDQVDIICKEHNRAHRGCEENKLKILQKYYFPKMAQQIKIFIRNCRTCNECKYDRNPIKSPMTITPLPSAPFEIMHVDILFMNKLYFLTSIDKISKYAQVVKIDSRAVVDILPALKEIILKHKPPEVIVMDGEKSFNSGNVRDSFNTFNIQPEY